MSSGWFPPKEDSPSVVSNRVFMIRRLNKMESQRLGVRLDGLNAEVQQTRSIISQEQQELRKQLTQIREVKENPAVSVERRKLLQQLSCKETRRPEQSLSGENQGGQQRYRSWSNDDRFRGAPLTQLPQVNGRTRSKSSCSPPRKEQLSNAFRKLSGGSNDRINNRSPLEAWHKGTLEKTKARQRSVSTGTYHSQELLNLEFRQSPTWVYKGTRRYTANSATALSDVEINRGQGRENTAISLQSSELVATQKERRQRSLSTNSAPIVSQGRVLEVCREESNKTNTPSSDKYVGSASSKHRRFSTNCRPKVIGGVVVDASDDKNCNSHRQSAPVHLTRRARSLSTNCPPVILEKKNVGESDIDKEIKQRSSSCESVDGSIEDGDYDINDDDFHGKTSQQICAFRTGDKTEQIQGNENSFPRL